MLHRRQHVLYQLPVGIRVLRLARRGGAHQLRSLPAGIFVARLIPVPVEHASVDLFRRTRGVVSRRSVVAQSRMARLLADAPFQARIHCRFRIGVPLHQKAGAVAHLRHRRRFAKIPHHRRNHIVPGAQQRSQVHCLKPPVKQIAARRPLRRILPVHVQHEPVVRAHVHPVVLRHSREHDLFAKVKHPRSLRRRRRAGNPARRPLRRHQIGIQRRVLRARGHEPDRFPPARLPCTAQQTTAYVVSSLDCRSDCSDSADRH